MLAEELLEWPKDWPSVTGTSHVGFCTGTCPGPSQPGHAAFLPHSHHDCLSALLPPSHPDHCLYPFPRTSLNPLLSVSLT